MSICKGAWVHVRRQPLALLALFVALGGTSFAATGRRAVSRARGERIYACIAPRRGTFRVTTARGRCRAGQRKVSWAVGAGVRGPAGPAGPRGATGPAGPQGPAGVADEAVLAAIDARLSALERDHERLRQDVAALRATVADLEAANVDLRGRLAAHEALLRGVSRPDATTLVFEGMNLHLRNGEGRTTTANGLGNLIVGYNESPGPQSGSHVIAIGPRHAFTGAVGLLAGTGNALRADYAAVLGGRGNDVTGDEAVIVGGWNNTAAGVTAAVLGGYANAASAGQATVSGGVDNYVNGAYGTISGGQGNVVSAASAAILGGYDNVASGVMATVVGGLGNWAQGKQASILGGEDVRLEADLAMHPAP